ncbi:MAG: DUF5305 family protein [Bacilli bacterium]|nr:DUF5305 family protein [Bacilli bacterium]
MKKNDKYRIIILLCTVFLIAILLLLNVFFSIKKLWFRSVLYQGNITHNMNYEVHIFENNYIENDVITNNYSFITDLVDYLVLNYNYTYNFNKTMNLNYSYVIKANVISNDEENSTNPVLNKEYILFSSDNKEIFSNTININESTSLSLIEYNDLINNFIEDFNLSLTSVLEVKLIVNIEGDINDNNINKEHYLLFSIPLDAKTFDITTSTNFTKEEKIYKSEDIDEKEIYVDIIINILVLSILVGCSYYITKHILDKYNSKYHMEKTKILKDYDSIIVEVKSFVNYMKWETVEVETFEELLNLSNEVFEPIFFFEQGTYANREAWFCILREKVLYKYVIYKQNSVK